MRDLKSGRLALSPALAHPMLQGELALEVLGFAFIGTHGTEVDPLLSLRAAEQASVHPLDEVWMLKREQVRLLCHLLRQPRSIAA